MHIVIFVTAKDQTEADVIAEKLLNEKLVACVNITQNIQSIFWWDQKIDRADEVLMIIKSRKDLFGKIVETVKANHSYSVPEVIALPIVDGNADYLKWIDDSTKH